eukprot:7375929-Prymnesium_polylepis.1
MRAEQRHSQAAAQNLAHARHRSLPTLPPRYLVTSLPRYLVTSLPRYLHTARKAQDNTTHGLGAWGPRLLRLGAWITRCSLSTHSGSDQAAERVPTSHRPNQPRAKAWERHGAQSVVSLGSQQVARELRGHQARGCCQHGAVTAHLLLARSASPARLQNTSLNTRPIARQHPARCYMYPIDLRLDDRPPTRPPPTKQLTVLYLLLTIHYQMYCLLSLPPAANYSQLCRPTFCVLSGLQTLSYVRTGDADAIQTAESDSPSYALRAAAESTEVCARPQTPRT